MSGAIKFTFKLASQKKQLSNFTIISEKTVQSDQYNKSNLFSLKTEKNINEQGMQWNGSKLMMLKNK